LKILVTGGAGYIGSVATEKLLGAGHDVVVFDDLSLGHREAVDPQAAFVEGSLADRDAIDGLFAEHRPEAVMHFASKTLVGESMEKPFLYLGDNVTNAANLLESMVRHGTKKFILSSTANLFDAPERIPIGPDERVVPGSPYGESKAIIERMLFWLEKTSGVSYACLRYFNAAGATEERGEDHDPELHLIPIVLQVAMGKRENVTVFGDTYDTPDGTCVRDYVHVADLAQAHILALEALDRGSRTYNLGNGNGFSVKEVIETAREVTGREIPVVMGKVREGDPAVLIADSGRISAELGWKPEYPDLKSIVESAWKWHLAHPEGY
jgi:UDP-glucose 4-epimerase